MKKQKICIIGGGLTGLLTAITLSKLNVKIDLIDSKKKANLKSNRTIAISQSNYDFLKKQNIFKLLNLFWPCSEMKLYTKEKNKKSSKVFELKDSHLPGKKILYIAKNSEIIQHMTKIIKKDKLISFKNKKKTCSISSSGLLKSVKYADNSSKYNLIIICTGNNSSLVKNYFKNQLFEKSYKEVSFTGLIKHKSIKNNIVRQIFLDNEILALLPISNNSTSIVWSVKKKTIYKDKINLFFKKNIKIYATPFLKKIKFLQNIEQRDLSLSIRKKYYRDRMILFGDALHVVHPLAGQGFNMVIRDLIKLEKVLKNNINLGLDIGSSDILSEFSKETKSKNFAYSMGIDFIRNSFSVEKENFKNLRNIIIKKLNRNSFAKNIFYNIADKGFRF